MTITTKISKHQINADSKYLLRRFRDNLFMYVTDLLQLQDIILHNYDSDKLQEIDSHLFMIKNEIIEVQKLLELKHGIKANFDISY